MLSIKFEHPLTTFRLLTWESGRGPRHRVQHVSLFGGSNNQWCPKPVGKVQVGVTFRRRGFSTEGSVVGKEQDADSCQRLASAGIAHMDLESHLCRANGER